MVLRKTDLVKRVESQFNRPLDRLLPEMINENGLSGTAEALGVKKSTLNYWLLKLGINVQRVVLAPGESVEVRPDGVRGASGVISGRSRVHRPVIRGLEACSC